SSGANIQGIGFSDGVNVLFYSIGGTRILNLEQWVPVYQGAFSNNTWNQYLFPIADDWFSFFEYYPLITSIVYVNDLDGISSRSVFFDNILNITSDINQAPQITVSYQITFQSAGLGTTRNVGVQFSSLVIDPDSDTFTYAWNFGDSTTSNLANPYHTYTVADNHPYRATLRVRDSGGKWGYASCLVEVDDGISSLPIRMNFIGDVMLARAYEQAGGIIPTLGVNAIFQPTVHLIGNAADITVANLEVVLCNVGTPHPTKSVVYRGSPSNISGLVYAGIDKVSTANNHTLDYGLVGMQQMIGLLEQNNIIHSGSGANSYEAYAPVFINKDGLNIAFLASSDRTGQYNNAQPYLQAGYNKPGFAYMTPYYIMQQINAVQGFADLKIVEMHGGSEYSVTPGSGYDKNNPFLGDLEDEDYNYRTDVPHLWDLEIRRWTVDSGADLVIVHHPHIIQGLEVYNGKLIAHSLGNFAFDLTYPETMPSMILYADADHSGFSNFLVRPLYIDDFIPKPATGVLAAHILDYLAMRSTELNTKLIVDYQDCSAKVVMDMDDLTANTSNYNFQKQLQPSGTIGNTTQPFKLPRYGSINSVTNVSPVSDGQLRLGKELIWFGNFEDEGSSLWSIPAFETMNAFDGARSALLAPSNGQTTTATFKRRMKCYDNTKKYTLHGWIKTRSATNANIIIRYWNTRTSTSTVGTENITANINGTTEWTWFYKELTFPSNAYFYDILLTITNSAGGTVQALFDNVGMVEWTNWLDLSSLATIPNPNNYLWMQAKTSQGAKSLSIGFSEQRYAFMAQRRSSKTISVPIRMSINPNPFRNDSKIGFELQGKAPASLKIYNIKGQRVKTMFDGILPEGKHILSWNGKDDKDRPVSSGIYFFRLEQNGHTANQKAIMLR
ncbi:MAG: CapA family protein, partial [Candidatus Cloacimonadaceae bacterium]|nr:CapA family protein [Candidatus Cloacimonadaceae bacterium]